MSATTPYVHSRSRFRLPPLLRLALSRLGTGILSITAVSVIVFWATLVLPGTAATAILGQSATPERLAALTEQLKLDQPPLEQFLSWIGNALTLNFGNSLANGESVVALLAPRLINTGVLLLIATVVSTVLGIVFGLLAAARRDGWFDHVSSVAALVASALPEFVVAIFVILVFSVAVFHWFPAVSVMPPGDTVLGHLDQLVLPALTLVIVVTPYVFRMMRAATIEALSSEYAELATLKGLSRGRILLRHAMPNALAPTVQVVGLNILYLAGGVVLVESVFNYQGVGLALVSAVTTRDVPVIQYVVLLLAVFYVLLNIATDLVVLALTPRRRKSV
ncbi:ABC transporter permease [Paenarthrobacter sp. NPDC091669]|uniref:ABC transporter permease n=1 Tax=Paenarthrobacter sp. NPDC091669 TaxID=3364384 RepID=UPI00381C1AFE